MLRSLDLGIDRSGYLDQGKCWTNCQTHLTQLKFNTKRVGKAPDGSCDQHDITTCATDWLRISFLVLTSSRQAVKF